MPKLFISFWRFKGECVLIEKYSRWSFLDDKISFLTNCILRSFSWHPFSALFVHNSSTSLIFMRQKKLLLIGYGYYDFTFLRNCILPCLTNDRCRKFQKKKKNTFKIMICWWKRKKQKYILCIQWCRKSTYESFSSSKKFLSFLRVTYWLQYQILIV